MSTAASVATWPGPPRAVPQFHYLESCRLPSLGPIARHCLSSSATNAITTSRSGRRRIQFRALPVWRSEDPTTDIEVRTASRARRRLRFNRLDAVRHGPKLAPTNAEQAVRHAVDAVEGLARNGYDHPLAGHQAGMELTWRSGS